jgi:hypothetical protein
MNHKNSMAHRKTILRVKNQNEQPSDELDFSLSLKGILPKLKVELMGQ